jgi:hypothetical protein
MDRSGIILAPNPTALERPGGRMAADVIGHHFSDFMTPELANARWTRF